MKNKGFTLIEITAVVLILGVIFLISFPTLHNILKKSEKDKIDVDSKNIIMAAKTYINLHKDAYDFTEGANQVVYLNDLVKEELIDDDKYSQVGVVNCKITNNKQECTVDKFPAYQNGTAIYFNPETAKLCTKEEATANVNKNKTPTEITTGCMKWYTFNDNGDNDTVNMILDHNTTAAIQKYGYEMGDLEQDIKDALNDDIKTWDDSVKVTARLISAEEVAQISLNSTFDASNYTTWFYLDSNSYKKEASSTVKSNYAWLFDYTYLCLSYGCNIQDNNKYTFANAGKDDYQYYTLNAYGTWTSSHSTYEMTNGTIIYGFWMLTRVSSLEFAGRNNGGLHEESGIRPVITIDKLLLE